MPQDEAADVALPEALRQAQEPRRHANEWEVRRLAMLENQQQARRDLEIKLLPAPTAKPSHSRLRVLPALLAGCSGGPSFCIPSGWRPWVDGAGRVALAESIQRMAGGYGDRPSILGLLPCVKALPYSLTIGE